MRTKNAFEEVVEAFGEPLGEVLEAAGDELEVAGGELSDDDEEDGDDPDHDHRVGDDEGTEFENGLCRGWQMVMAFRGGEAGNDAEKPNG